MSDCGSRLPAVKRRFRKEDNGGKKLSGSRTLAEGHESTHRPPTTENRQLMHLIFCGTPNFAVPTLERLVAEKYAIDLVVTNQDEPSGRGYELKAPPVKQAALRAGLEVYQPE